MKNAPCLRCGHEALVCVQCARPAPLLPEGWAPGEYLLFGRCYVCSVACARTYALRETKYAGVPDGALVDPAMDWHYAAAADDGDEGTLCATTTPDDLEAMRVVRNTCREFMTGNTREIDITAQICWFASLDPAETKPFVFRVGGAPIGYGLVRRLNGDWWLSGGLLPPWRGRGYGKRLFAALAAVAGKPCWLDVRKDNAAGRRTYEALGFLPVHRVDDDTAVIMMRLG